MADGEELLFEGGGDHDDGDIMSIREDECPRISEGGSLMLASINPST